MQHCFSFPVTVSKTVGQIIGAQSVVHGLNAVIVGTCFDWHNGLKGGTVTVAVAVGMSHMIAGQKSVKGVHVGFSVVIVER